MPRRRRCRRRQRLTAPLSSTAAAPDRKLAPRGVRLGAVWSRTQAAADAFAATAVADVAPGVPALSGEDGLAAILSDAAIHAVIVVLPVQVALGIVQRALAAGKHVIEEKPIGPTVAQAEAAVAAHRASTAARPPLWLYAENYGYERVFREAAARAPSLGAIVKLDLVAGARYSLARSLAHLAAVFAAPALRPVRAHA